MQPFDQQGRDHLQTLTGDEVLAHFFKRRDLRRKDDQTLGKEREFDRLAARIAQEKLYLQATPPTVSFLEFWRREVDRARPEEGEGHRAHGQLLTDVPSLRETRATKATLQPLAKAKALTTAQKEWVAQEIAVAEASSRRVTKKLVAQLVKEIRASSPPVFAAHDEESGPVADPPAGVDETEITSGDGDADLPLTGCVDQFVDEVNAEGISDDSASEDEIESAAAGTGNAIAGDGAPAAKVNDSPGVIASPEGTSADALEKTDSAVSMEAGGTANRNDAGGAEVEPNENGVLPVRELDVIVAGDRATAPDGLRVTSLGSATVTGPCPEIVVPPVAGVRRWKRNWTTRETALASIAATLLAVWLLLPSAAQPKATTMVKNKGAAKPRPVVSPPVAVAARPPSRPTRPSAPNLARVKAKVAPSPVTVARAPRIITALTPVRFERVQTRDLPLNEIDVPAGAEVLSGASPPRATAPPAPGHAKKQTHRRKRTRHRHPPAALPRRNVQSKESLVKSPPSSRPSDDSLSAFAK